MSVIMSERIPRTKRTIPLAGYDHIQGSINAPIKLLEFGDYECPVCAEIYPLIKAIQKQLGDDLCFAFRNFPLTKIHPHAEHAAEAAEAAGAQGNFWGMHDQLFENQEALDDTDIALYATALGLDARQLITEVLRGVYSDRIREDFMSGVRGGVNGTPTFFVNGARYDGPRVLADMLAALAPTGIR
jgi:protein-disulfide isomerase